MMFPSLFGEVASGVSVGEFGDKFRKAREKKNLSLDDVSNVTKIGSRMLQAIEEERFDQLPGGVFNKGFIRAYAKHLGLNDEDAVTDYLACLRQAQIDAHEVWQPQPTGQTRAGATERPRAVQPNRPAPTPIRAAEKTQPPAHIEELPELQLPRAEDVRPRRREFIRESESAIPWRMLIVAAVVIIVAVVLWARRSHRTNAAATVATPVQTAGSAPIAAPAPAVNKALSTTTPAGRTKVARGSASNPQSSLRPASSAATHPAALAAVSSPAAAAPDNSDEHFNNNNNSNNNGTAVQTLPKANPGSSEKSVTPLTLVIRATETSWISVLADGQTVSQETLIAPANTSVRANREIIAKIGNAAGVTFLFNGQEIPADGAEAEVKTFVFDSNGMRVAAATPTPAQ
jgi:cytoskeletal protein RodZ